MCQRLLQPQNLQTGNSPSSDMDGVKVSLGTECMFGRSHTAMPSAHPAAIAAPRAVASDITGRTGTRQQTMITWSIVFHADRVNQECTPLC